MYITARLDYATRALLALAAAPDGDLVKADTIAEQQGLPSKKFVENILCELRHAGLLMSRRGNLGGFRLARPANEITLADVVCALRMPLAEVHAQPLDPAVGDAHVDNLSAVWAGVHAALQLALGSVTLAQIASGELPASVNDRQPAR